MSEVQVIVETVDEKGNPLELLVNKPTAKNNADAQIIFSREWLKAEANGCPLRAKLDEIAVKHGLWNEEMEKQVKKIEGEVLETERKLRAGSKYYKTKLEAKEAALKVRKLRQDRIKLFSKKNSLYEHSAEGNADRARTNYLISVCVVYANNGKQYFVDMNDYLNRAEEKASVDAVEAFLKLVYADLLDVDKKNYENQLLLKLGFVDEKFRLINKDGNLVDENGKEIDENGRYVKNGKFVDADGNEVDENGEYVIEFEPFSD
jgi:hypothetical protein